MKQQCESGASHYSTTEQFTGMYWIDGKKIYRKVIDFGSLPNASNKTVAHNISNIDHIINLHGFYYKSGIPGQPVPYVSVNTNYLVCLYANDATTVSIDTSYNFSANKAYIIMEYTKTTD